MRSDEFCGSRGKYSWTRDKGSERMTKRWRSSVWEDEEGAIHVEDSSVERLRKKIWRLIFEARDTDEISDADTAWALARVQYELIHHFNPDDDRNKSEG